MVGGGALGGAVTACQPRAFACVCDAGFQTNSSSAQNDAEEALVRPAGLRALSMLVSIARVMAPHTPASQDPGASEPQRH